MKDKLKGKSTTFLQILKSAILGVIVSMVLVLILALVLKFVELGDGVISVIDEIIKIVSIFVAMISLVKKSPYKILYKGIILGIMYVILTFIVFSSLRGNYSLTTSTLFDVVLGAITGGIIAIILNIFTKEKVVA